MLKLSVLVFVLLTAPTLCAAAWPGSDAKATEEGWVQIGNRRDSPQHLATHPKLQEQLARIGGQTINASVQNRPSTKADFAGASTGAGGVRINRHYNADQPFVIYFASRTPAKSDLADNSIASAVAPKIIWENPALSKELERVGITTYVKLYTDLNLILAGKCGVTDDSLVIYATDGTKLAAFIGPQCRLDIVLEYLKTFQESYTAFKVENSI